MFIYSLQTTFKYSQDEWRPECIVCFYTTPEDALLIPLFTKTDVIFLFCKVPFNEENGNFTTEAIHVVLDYALELRDKITNKDIWVTTDNKCSRLSFKRGGEQSLDEFDFSVNKWRKKKSHMAFSSVDIHGVILKDCSLLRFPKKA